MRTFRVRTLPRDETRSQAASRTPTTAPRFPERRASAAGQRQLEAGANSAPRARRLQALLQKIDASPRALRHDGLLQMRMIFDRRTAHLDPDSEILEWAFYNPTYVATIGVAKQLDHDITVKQVENVTVGLGAKEGSATASYVPETKEIHVRESNRQKYQNDRRALEQTLSGELGAFAHEVEHATDHLTGTVAYTDGSETAQENKIRTEWRAWAIEAAVATRHRDAGLTTTQFQDGLIASYSSKEQFKDQEGYAWRRSRKYFQVYLDFNEKSQIVRFMDAHNDWIDEALEYYQRNLEYL